EFSVLVEHGYVQPGQRLFFGKDKTKVAVIKPDSRLRTADGFEGSIHQAGSHYMNNAPCNGWEHWFIEVDGQMISLGEVREKFRVNKGLYHERSG
ncbi:MAG: site-specific DNA-methyltransferase, partial [Chloroflexi bacterium]